MSGAVSEDPYWSQDASALAAVLESGAGGLSSDRAVAQLALVGANSVDDSSSLSAAAEGSDRHVDVAVLQDAVTARLGRRIGNLVTYAGKPVVHIGTALRHTLDRAIRAEARNALRLWRDGHRGEAREALADARRRIGRLTDVSPYILRHTFATELHRRDVPLDDIAAFLGHTPRLRITAMYPRRGPENVARAVAAIDPYLSELRTLVDASGAEHAGGPTCGRR